MATPSLRLIVALDFSECSRLALLAALSIAERSVPAELVALTVIESQPDEVTALNTLEHAVDDLRKMVDDARGGRALPAGVTVRYAAMQGDPAHEIAAQARAQRADAIVLGTHGRKGLDRLLTGSVAETVVRIAPCSVLTVKPGGRLLA